MADAEGNSERIKDPQTVAAILAASIPERAMKTGKVATADLPKAIVKLYRETLAALQKGQAISDKGVRDLYKERAQAAEK